MESTKLLLEPINWFSKVVGHNVNMKIQLDPHMIAAKLKNEISKSPFIIASKT